MDIQFIAKESLALTHYVTGYITKAERSNMQDIWNEVSLEKSIYSGLFSFGIQSMQSRKCSLYEASDLHLGEQLCGNTRESVGSRITRSLKSSRARTLSHLTSLKATS